MSSVKLYIVHLLLKALPLTRGWRIKRLLFRWAGASIAENVRLLSTVQIFTTGSISIGKNTWVGHEALMIGGDAAIIIGAEVDIGPRVTFVTGTHDITTISGRAAGEGRSEKIHLNDGVWVGASATVMGGVNIGMCSIIAAGALVNKDVPSYCLVAGVPARVIRKLDRPDIS